jgi:type IV pilus assembly protein PilC
MLFYYRAKKSTGEEVSGSIEALDQQSALTELSDRGLWTTTISSQEKKNPLNMEISFLSWIPNSVFNAFLLQLSVMIRSGVPLIESLASLEQGETNRTLKRIIQDVRREVEKGNPLSDALSMHPQHFDAFFVNMVRIGETGGVLEKVLIKLSDIRQRSVALRNQILGALAYPALLVLVVSAVLMLLFGFALPRFAAIFKAANFPLPWQTKLVMDIGAFVNTNFNGLIVAGIILLLLAASMIITRTGRWIAGEVTLRIPLLRQVVKSFLMVHISEAMSMLLSAGVPLLELLVSIEKTLAMPTARNTLGQMRSFVERGSSMRLALESDRIFSPMALKLIETGEKTGNLDRMFEEIAAYYDNVLQASIKTVLSLLEPFLILIMAGIVGFIILSVILPILQMSSVFKGA